MLGIGRAGPLGPVNLAIDDERQDGGQPPGDVSEVRVASPGGGGAPGGVSPSSAERDAAAVLVSVPELGPMTLARLVAAFGSASATLDAARGPGGARLLVHATIDETGVRPPLTAELTAAIVESANRADAVLANIAAAGLEVVVLDDPHYPPRLRAIELPPPVIFVRGRVEALLERRSVAVVGTRHPTERGRLTAARIAGALARCGAAVVSGLAVGIDGAAHAGAVAERGPTIAVLGGGHRHLYPAAHARLAAAIVDSGGAVISELEPNTRATAGTFPRRNRLIAGLSEAVVVVEAGEHSGALITAAWALEQGRGCFLVPGAIDAPMAAGCLAFLRAFPGPARLVAGIPELLEDLELAAPAQSPAEPSARARRSNTGGVPPPGLDAVLGALGSTARLVAREVAAGRSSIDELVAATTLPVATILATVTVLEAQGLVATAYGRIRPIGRLATAAPDGQSNGRCRARGRPGPKVEPDG
jgi:DNA processing protein